MTYTSLFQPLTIGTMTVKNRAFLSAMGTNFLEPVTGNLTPKLYDYYEARAKGGYGLIFIEDTAVSQQGMWSLASSRISEDRFVPQFKILTDRIHAHGAKVVLEIAHLGRSTDETCNGGIAPCSASPIPDYLSDNQVLGMDLEDIAKVRQDFIDAARRTQEAGFDGVELHATHGYLLASFLSGRTNKRVDAYGGTLEGRLKLILEIITGIQAQCGKEFPILVRLASVEANGGRKLEESRVIAKALEDAGVAALDISAGSTCEKEWIVPPSYFGYGNNVENIEKIKSSVSIPVLASGRITEPRLANQLLAEGRCDMVGLNRAGIADPDIVIKAETGRTDEIRRCIGCARCINSLVGVDHLQCTVNPYVGHEGEMDLSVVETPKKVLVVGAGPVGLECANLAAQKGHKVTVVEADRQVGGQIRAAAVPPDKYEIGGLIAVQMAVAEKLGVEVICNTKADSAFVDAFAPDAVIFATGAKPTVPPIPGIDGENVVTAVDLLEGNAHAGDNVVILGGGIIGCETAEFLAPYVKKNITLLEMMPTIGAELCPHVAGQTFRTLAEADATLLANAKVTEIGPDYVKYQQNGESHTLSHVDTVVLALGTRGDNTLYTSMEGASYPMFLVGDAVHSGRLNDAMSRCYEVVNQLA